MKLYRYQFVDNGVGLWKNDWFLEPAKAELARQDAIKCGYGPQDGEDWDEYSPIGADGDITEVEEIDVELTPDGILTFARDRAFAADE